MSINCHGLEITSRQGIESQQWSLFTTSMAIALSKLDFTDINCKCGIDIAEGSRRHHPTPMVPARARPVKFVTGDWDNESDENVIESVTLTFDFFELIW